MYKNNSENMQRRASRLPMMMSGCDEDNLLKDAAEKRKALVNNLHKYELRIMEIREILKVPNGFLFHKINPHAFPKNCREWIEWQTLVKKIEEVRLQLKDCPRVKGLSLARYIEEYLKQNYPDIHKICLIGARRMVEEDLKKNSPKTLS